MPLPLKPNAPKPLHPELSDTPKPARNRLDGSLASTVTCLLGLRFWVPMWVPLRCVAA